MSLRAVCVSTCLLLAALPACAAPDSAATPAPSPTPGFARSIDLSGAWKLNYDTRNVGLQEGWDRADFDDSSWHEKPVPAPWEDSYDGDGWYRRTVDIDPPTSAVASAPVSAANPHRFLVFDQVDDNAHVYLDSRLAATNLGYNKPFYIDLDKFLISTPEVVTTPTAEAPLAAGKRRLHISVQVTDLGGEGGILKPVRIMTGTDPTDVYKSSVSDLEAPTPLHQIGGTVIYSVYVRNFSKEGTFDALRRRLPELKALGVNTLWLLPIHQIGNEKRKGVDGSPYAIKDYYSIDPALGTKDDFKALVRDVHAQGMKIIIDCVLNHTSPDSVLATEHPDWFRLDMNDKPMPANPDWSDIVDLNWKKREVWDYSLKFLEYWVREFDIDGYRCDVADLMPGDFWKELRAHLEAIKPHKILMLAESEQPEKLLQGFDMIYNQSIRDAAIDEARGRGSADGIRKAITTTYVGLPRHGVPMLFVENHDKERAMNEYGSAAAVKAGGVLTATLPGVPLLYTGTEVGAAESRDPAFFKRTAVDFTTATATEMRQFWTDLLALRAKHPALQIGDFRQLDVMPGAAAEQVVAYERHEGDDRVTVAVNLSSKPAKGTITGGAAPVDVDLAPFGWKVIPAK